MHLQPERAASPSRALPRQLVALVTSWSVQSQQRARRNAMIASTMLAQRRIEREDVADFLARRAGHVEPQDGASDTVSR